MKNALKVVFGCLALLWALRSAILLPSALSHAQTAYGKGAAFGLVIALAVSAILGVILFRSAFRKPERTRGIADNPEIAHHRRPGRKPEEEDHGRGSQT